MPTRGSLFSSKRRLSTPSCSERCGQPPENLLVPIDLDEMSPTCRTGQPDGQTPPTRRCRRLLPTSWLGPVMHHESGEWLPLSHINASGFLPSSGRLPEAQAPNPTSGPRHRCKSTGVWRPSGFGRVPKNTSRPTGWIRRATKARLQISQPNQY